MTGKKIMVVDNQPIVLKFMSQLLEKAGHEVLLAKDGLTALEILATETPDILFVDLIMPNINGDKLCKIIRRAPRFQDTVIVILSAIAAEQEVDFCAWGADACIAKGPFNRMGEHVLSLLEQLGETRPIFLTSNTLGIQDVYPRQVTMELLSVKRHFETILESMAEGILELTEEAKIVYANFVALTLMGVPEENLLASDFRDYFSPEDRERIDRLLEPSDSPVRRIPESEPILFRDRQIALSVIQIGSDEMKYIALLNDITEKKLMEYQLQQAQKLEALGNLAAGITHDFNNILTGVIGNISLAKMYVSSNEKVHEIMDKAEKASLKARELTQQVLTFARGGDPIKKPTSLAEIVRLVTRTPPAKTTTQYELTKPDNLMLVMVDPGQLRQALSNLLSYSALAGPHGGTVRINAQNVRLEKNDPLPLQAGNYVKITIADEGAGVPYDQKAKIFDPYFSSRQGGHGIGLATAYSIIKRHGGFIAFDSKLGTGSTFEIYLPGTETEVLALKSEPEDFFAKKLRILVMDDEDMIREVLSDMLQQVGCEVSLARDGREAIGLYRKALEAGKSFDVVIMDLTVPMGMGGKEAISKLTEMDPQVKAIVSSGYSDDPVMANFREYGFSALVSKPFRFKELVKTLQNVLAGSPE